MGIIKILDKYWLLCTSSLLLVMLLLLSLQGFDLTDEGFVLVAYQNFFEDTQYASHMFGMYLTAFFGGVWEKIFGWGGWYSFRIFNAFIIMGGYCLLCHTLREYWKYKWYITIAFVVVIINMYIAHGTLVFHYYTFSAFLNCLILFCLYSFIVTGKVSVLFVSSFVIGLNIFTRVPNITLCAIPFVITLFQFLSHKNIKTLYRQTVIIFSGIITGLLFVTVLLWGLGHMNLFIEQIERLRAIASSSTNNHGIIPMLVVTFNNLKYIIIVTSIISIFIAVGLYSIRFRIEKFINNTNSANCLRCGFLVILIAILYHYLRIHNWEIPYYSNVVLYSIAHAFILFSVIVSKDVNKISLAIIVVLISHLQPLGSDYGIGNMGPYSIWGLFPVSIVLFLDSIQKYLITNEIKTGHTLHIAILILFCCLFYGSFNPYKIMRVCYRDEGSRCEKKYLLGQSRFATVYTSKERQEELDNLLGHCEKYFQEGDYVLFASDVPGLHYLTKTKPFMGNPWPRLYESDVFMFRLNSSLKEKGRPVVVTHDDPLYFNKTNPRHVAGKKIIENFLQEEKYHLIWESKYYKLYSM